MFKERSFLEKNIKKIQEYQKSGKDKYKNWYDKWETIERQFWEWLTKIFFQIEEKLQTKKHKNLFRNWFIQELNNLYKDWLSPTEYKYLKEKLTKIQNELDLLNSYKIESNFKKHLQEIISNKYKENLKELELQIINGKEINKTELVINFVKKIPPLNSDNIIEEITLDKNWSFDDIEINSINFSKFWTEAQGFVINIWDKQHFIVKTKWKIIKFLNIKNLSVNNNENTIRISFENNNKKFVLFTAEKQLYQVSVPLSFYKKYISNIWEKIYSLLNVKKLLKSDIEIYKKYMESIKKKIKIKKQKVEKKYKQENNRESKNTKKNQKTSWENLENKHKEKQSQKEISNTKLAKLDTHERLKIIEKYLDSPEMNKYYNMLFNQLVWKKVYLVDEKTNKTKIIAFTENFIKKNKTELVNNLKSILLMVINIESDWDPLAKNKKWSSARWLWQWLIWNWRYKKNKEWKIYYATSSWETTLNNIWKNYPEKITNFISWFPEKKITKPFKIKPQNIHWHDQVKILTLSLIWKNDEILMASLLWNQWWLTELYKLYHTNPKKDTIERIKKISPKYISTLNQYNLSKQDFQT